MTVRDEADDVADAFGAVRCSGCGQLVSQDNVVAEIYDEHGRYEGVTACAACSEAASDDVAVAFGAWRCYVCQKVCGAGYLGATGICGEACAVVWRDSQNKMIERWAERLRGRKSMTGREQAEDVATVLGAPACAVCGGMLVRSGKVHSTPFVVGVAETFERVSVIKWELLSCRRCAEKYAARPEHEDGCFCSECLR